MNDVGQADMAERRSAVRYPLSWPVILEDGTGMTRDISSSGVYFETDRELECGAVIDFGLVLPEAADTPCYLSCQGEVVRVERYGPRLAMAIKFTRMSFGDGF
jgi:PilZ domain